MMKKGDILLGKDLKPGMAVKRVIHSLAKLVVEVDLEGNNELFDGEPNLQFFDLNDPYYGPCYVQLMPEDEFEILHEYNTEEYVKMIVMIRKALTDNIKAAVESIEELDNLTEEYVV